MASPARPRWTRLRVAIAATSILLHALVFALPGLVARGNAVRPGRTLSVTAEVPPESCAFEVPQPERAPQLEPLDEPPDPRVVETEVAEAIAEPEARPAAHVVYALAAPVDVGRLRWTPPKAAAPAVALAAAPAAEPRAPMLPPTVVAARRIGGDEPSYPREARRRAEQGAVLLRLAISADGCVVDARVETSSGHAALDSAALAAVRNWTYEPELRDGVRVASEQLHRVTFVLEAR